VVLDLESTISLLKKHKLMIEDLETLGNGELLR
jgi:hypothetical protein